ncbi:MULTISPECIES: SLC13 family permease [Lawsonibacter]|uniref:Citrate transporter n=1 Tax=Lawsonibacter hominis TaxID=2763053 RepID=A0A8J6J8D8_9FIRM|nr:MULTISPECIES: SLC13 family permease [Lawsonibacter]MBC5734711.1 citrate transporter [Lawsonibacter hominis]MCI6400116.1 citrate transporter [Lawsonibacter sp.]
MRQTGLRMLSWLRREPVLCISAVCAALSMLLTPPSAAYLNYVDWRVISLLFCLMAVVAGLQDCGVFAVLAQRLLAGEKRLRFVTLVLVLLPFFTSMLVTNDVALITFVPFSILVLGLIGRTERLAYVVVLQTIAANLGSMATPVGNPQNLYLYATYELTPGQFFTAVLPLVLASLAGLTAAAVWGRPESIRVAFPQPVRVRRPGRLGLMCLLFVLCLLCVCRLLPYPALVAVVLSALVIFGRDLFRRLDYALLLTFVCFFLFAGNVGANPAVREVLTAVLARNTALASGIASQVISNVPAAVLLSGFTADWRGLLIGVNVGGLGTPIASLASLISLKAYLRSAGARPGRYLAVFLLANGIALAVLCACAWLLGRLQ